jgi:Protein of unknown function (DUF2950)
MRDISGCDGEQAGPAQQENIMPILTNTFDGSQLRRREALPLVASIAVLMAGLAPLAEANPSSANSDQPTYVSAEDAAGALFQALQSGNEQAVEKVLGADHELVSSADAAADERDREQFVQKYQQMHRLARQSDGTKILYIGAENWPFPVPLVATNGVWRFDSDAGAKEVLFRRIGENEITVMQACHSLAEARRGPGTDNAATAPEGAGGLVTTLLSTTAGGDKAVPYHGYYFRILSRSPDGFAAVAYPVAYRSSGVMTFLVTQSEAIYEKDLGPAGAQTVQTASKIRPDATWAPADETADR